MNVREKLNEGFEKTAFIPIPAWGGGRYNIGADHSPISLEAGYSYPFGIIPTPDLGLRFGTKDKGLGIGISAMMPYVSIDDGAKSGWNPSRQRNLWRVILDNIQGDRTIYDQDGSKHTIDPNQGNIYDRLEYTEGVDEADEYLAKVLKGIKSKPTQAGDSNGERIEVKAANLRNELEAGFNKIAELTLDIDLGDLQNGSTTTQ